MSVLNDTWRFLVQRRLWPVAILLIAAAAAVPMLLAEEPAPPPAAPAVAVKADKDASCSPPSRSSRRPPTATAPAAGRCSARARTRSSRRPPRPRRRSRRARPSDADQPAPAPRRQRRRRHAVVGGSPAPGAGDRRFPAPTRRKKKTLRALRADRALRRDERRDLRAATSSACRRCRPAATRADLPGRARRQEDRGLHGRLRRRRPGRRQLQALAHRAARPSTSSEGETEFFDVASATDGQPRTGAQYQLDVIKIRKKTTTNAKQAKAAKARVSTQGPPDRARPDRRRRAAPLPLRQEVGAAGEALQEGLQGRRRQGGQGRHAPTSTVSGHSGRRARPGAR